MKRRNILVSAYAFSPYQGSECAIGWNVVTRLAKFHDVTVLCGDLAGSRKMKADLDRYFEVNPAIKGLTIQYVDTNWLIRIFEQLHNIPGLWMLYYLAYNVWQRKAYHTARDLHTKCPFDLAHHLTMQGYREPGYLWKLPIPFIWGPVGGCADEPLSFLGLFSLRGKLNVITRHICNSIQKRLPSRVKKVSHVAKLIFSATPADEYVIRNLWKASPVPMIDMGGSPDPQAQPHSWNGDSPLKLVWSGLFFPRKALPIILHAISRLSESERNKCHLIVLGSGLEENKWKQLAECLKLLHNIEWKGMLPYNEAINIMKSAHVCVLPSIKESASAVTLEALSLGLPVICHDACGMGFAVNESCGIKIPLRNPETSIEGFRDAIHELLSNPRKVEELSRGALERADELSWDKKVESFASVYSEIDVNRK